MAVYNVSGMVRMDRRIIVALAGLALLASCSAGAVSNRSAAARTTTTTETRPTTTESAASSSIAATPCSPSELLVTVNGFGAVGAAEAIYVPVEVRNKGSMACVLDNQITAAALLNASGKTLHIVFNVRCTYSCTGSLDLAPNAVAIEDFEWWNWCGPLPGPVEVNLTVQGLGLLLAKLSNVPSGHVVGASMGATAGCIDTAGTPTLHVDFGWNGGPTAP